MFSGAGWSVRHIHSNLHKTERKKIIREVKQGTINILVTVGVGVEGMDIPGLYGIIWMRLTGSLTIYMQFNGRPMRPAPGKKYFVMIDPVGNSVLHGRPDIDRKWSLETGYVPGEEAPEGTTAKICPVCNVSNSPENGTCWICGYDFVTGLLDGEEVTKKKRKLPKMIDGELVYLDGERDGLINKDINILTEGEDGYGNLYNGSNDSLDNRLHSGQGEGDRKDIETEQIQLTKIEKVNILTKDLTGFKRKSKFKEGVEGWL
jgi:hypothetical protein